MFILFIHKTKSYLNTPQKENCISRNKILLANKNTPASSEKMPPWLTWQNYHKDFLYHSLSLWL